MGGKGKLPGVCLRTEASTFLSLDSGPDVCPVLQKYKKPLLNSVPNVMSTSVFFSKSLSLSKKGEGNHMAVNFLCRAVGRQAVRQTT